MFLEFETIDSTNLEMKRHLLRTGPEGATVGSIIWARAQSEGRGRLGRSWVSEPGNLYFTLLLDRHPGGLHPAWRFYAAISALAVWTGLASCLEHLDPGLDLGLDPPGTLGLHPGTLAIKWPNDVILGGKKIAGLLLETCVVSSWAYILVGVGVNIKHAPEALPDSLFEAGCLEAHLGPGIDPGSRSFSPFDVLSRVVSAFDNSFQFWHKNGAQRGLACLEEKLIGLHRPARLRVSPHEPALEGIVRGLASDGRLRFEERATGRERHLSTGEIIQLHPTLEAPLPG